MNTAELIAYSKSLAAESDAIGAKRRMLCDEWESLHEAVYIENRDFSQWMHAMRQFPRHFHGNRDNGAG
jgi:hypothetical protein